MAKNARCAACNDEAAIEWNGAPVRAPTHPRPIDMVVGHRLAELRNLNGLTVHALGGALQIPMHLINDYESGYVRAPPHVLLDLTKFFGIALADLFAQPSQRINQQGNATVSRLQ